MASENASWENAWVFRQDGEYREYILSLERTLGPFTTCVTVNDKEFDTRELGTAKLDAFKRIGSGVMGGANNPLVLNSVLHNPLIPRLPPKQYLSLSDGGSRGTDEFEMVGNDESRGGRDVVGGKEEGWHMFRFQFCLSCS